MKKMAYTIGIAAMLASCSPKSNMVTYPVNGRNSGHEPETVLVPEELPKQEIGSAPVGIVLNASAFQMSGNYGHNVAVTLDPQGQLIYFPAPTDLSASSEPIEIGDGWWLNRQGLGPESVFTKWTFEEYRALKRVPSLDEIKAAIIPGARVTAYKTLGVTASQAATMTPAQLLPYVE